MRIQITLSSKGAGGKTPLALSLILNHIQAGRPVIAIDCNSNSPELARILANIAAKNEKKIVCKKEETFTCIKVSEFLHLIFRNSPFRPLSLEGFWRLLAGINKHIQTSGHSLETICVVDTVFNLPSLDPNTESSRTALQELGKVDIELFNIWAVASMKVRSQILSRFEDVDEFRDIKNTLRNIDRIGESNSNVIHVFSPRPFLRATGTTKIGKILDGRLERDTGKLLPISEEEFESFKRKTLDRNLQMLLEGKQQKSLEQLVEKINLTRYLEEEQKADYSFEKLENEVFRDIFTIINSWEYNRPWNVLVIPELVPEIINISEMLSFSNNLTFERIKELLNRFYLEVSDWNYEFENKREKAVNVEN